MRDRLTLSTLGPLAALFALILLGAGLNENFLSAANVTNVLARSAFIGMIAVGMTFVITSGGANRMIFVCVGLASKPFSASLTQISQAKFI